MKISYLMLNYIRINFFCSQGVPEFCKIFASKKTVAWTAFKFAIKRFE